MGLGYIHHRTYMTLHYGSHMVVLYESFMAPSERSELGAYQTITGSGVQPQDAHGGVIYG